MIKEEIVKIFQDKIDTMERGALCFDYGKDKDAFISAIQALEQHCEDAIIDKHYWKGFNNGVRTEKFRESKRREPCDDAISRHAVLEIAKSSKSNWIDNSVLFKRVNELPSVTSKPKEGHWIKEKSLHGWDGKSYQCSVCGRSIHIDPEVEDLSDYPYCHCGAKMVRSQEDEDNTN